jgi:NADH-quinone oxidoreductase subunit G
LTVEDAYAYSKFARLVLGSNDVDFRARPHSTEEQDFLAAAVAGRYLETTYADIEAAPAVVVAGLDPEEECPILFLRLRKAALTNGTQVHSVAPFATNGLRKTNGTLLQAPPGAEATVLSSPEAAAALAAEGSILLVGERLATAPGALSAAIRLAATTGARLAWVPRRAGDRGALEAGCLPGLLPAGRPAADAQARAEIAAAWGVDTLPEGAGRNTDEMLRAAAAGEIALVVGAVDIRDLPDPQLALDALEGAPFVVSLELRESPVTDRADVVLPVAPSVEKSGSYLDWEGRVRPFDATLESTGAMADGRVLHRLAEVMNVDLRLPDAREAQREIAQIGPWSGSRPAAPDVAAPSVTTPQQGEAVLASWHLLLDDGRLQEHEPYLEGTRKPAQALVSETTAKEAGLSVDGLLSLTTDRGSVSLPWAVADLPDRVVWAPTLSPGSHLHEVLGVTAGAVVRLSAARSDAGGAA